MNQLEYLMSEISRLERENQRLQESNALLSRCLYHASQKLHSYRIPVQHKTPTGKLSFTRHGDMVLVTYVEPSEAISQTGDPYLDKIFNERGKTASW